MTPASILNDIKSDDVSLALSPAGKITATGNQAAINRWLPTIREHKATLEEHFLLTWLDHIGEADQTIIAHILSMIRTDQESRVYFLRLAGTPD